jgi:hypothetical protein
MADDGRVIIRISALPDSALRRALTGTVDAARKATRAIGAERTRVARDVQHSEETQRSEANKTATDRVRAAERAGTFERREAEKTARTQIREAQRATKEQNKLSQQSAETRRRFMVGVAGGAYGGLKGGAALAQRGFGLAGMGSLEERLQTAGDFRAQLIRTAGEAKATPEERAKVEADLLKASVETNISIMDLVAGLATAQSRFDKFKEFSATIGDIAKVSQATGENLDDLVGAIGTASTVFQLDESGQREFINALIATSERGSINVGDFARNLAGTAGSFQVATGRTGIQGAREFLAAAQILGTSQVGAAETATMIERLMSQLSLPDTQAKLKQIGVDVLGEEGKLKNVGEIGQMLLANKQFEKAGVRQAVFPEIRAMRGAEFLTAELKRNPEAFAKLENAAGGADSVNRRFGELSADPLFKLRNVGVRAQADTVRDAERIVKTITPAVTELAKLQTKFPLLTESVGTLENAVRWAGGILLADRLARGGGGGGAGIGTTAGEAFGKVASVSVKEAFGSASMLGKVGLLGQAVGVGFTSYLATKELLSVMGFDDAKLMDMGARLYDKIFGPHTPPTLTTSGSLVDDAAATTAAKVAKETAAQQVEAETVLGKFLGSGVSPDSAATIPGAATPSAELTIKIVGPGQLTKLDSQGFGMIETVSTDTGRRDSFPP